MKVIYEIWRFKHRCGFSASFAALKLGFLGLCKGPHVLVTWTHKGGGWMVMRGGMLALFQADLPSCCNHFGVLCQLKASPLPCFKQEFWKLCIWPSSMFASRKPCVFLLLFTYCMCITSQIYCSFITVELSQMIVEKWLYCNPDKETGSPTLN